MLEIDKGGGNYQRNDQPIRECDLPRENLPDDEEEKSREQLDRKIAKSNGCAATAAASAQHDPTNEW